MNLAFTLVELLISVSVLSIVLGASYLCLHAGLDTRTSVETHADAIQLARVALAVMTADLRSTVPLSDEMEFVGTDRETGGVETDLVDFATHHWTPQVQGEGDVCEVSYYVDGSRDTSGLSLWRRRDPTPDREPLEGGLKEEVVRGLRGLKLEYYDGYAWHDSWGRQSLRTREETERSLLATNLYGLPDAVRITMAFEAPAGRPVPAQPEESHRGKPLTFQTVVFLTLAARVRAATNGTGVSSNNGGFGEGEKAGEGGEKEAGER